MINILAHFCQSMTPNFGCRSMEEGKAAALLFTGFGLIVQMITLNP